MSSGLDVWMDSWSEEDRKRNLKINSNPIPPEFGGSSEPIECITGKKYQQLEFDFGEKREPKNDDYKNELWNLKNNVGNYILQAKAVVDLVMSNIGEGGRDHDNHEWALWGASELLQNAMDLIE